MNTIQKLETLSGKTIEKMLHEKGTEFELKNGQYVGIIRETKTKIVIATRKTEKDLTPYYLREFAKHLGITSKELKEKLEDVKETPVEEPKQKPTFELVADRAEPYYQGRPAYKVPTDKKSGKKIHHWSHVVKTFRGKINVYDKVTPKVVNRILQEMFDKYECDHELITEKCWSYVERKFGVSR